MITEAAVLVLALGTAQCDQGRGCVQLAGHVERGTGYHRPFGPGFTILLEPNEYGWTIVVRDDRPTENIARLTPPFHFVPNPRDIEGWHFRNVGNTGPNDGSVNAPQEEREFVFSPEVGRTLDYRPTPNQIQQLLSSGGKGRLTIRLLTLGNLIPEKKAWIESMDFTLDLSWPLSWENRTR